MRERIRQKFSIIYSANFHDTLLFQFDWKFDTKTIHWIFFIQRIAVKGTQTHSLLEVCIAVEVFQTREILDQKFASFSVINHFQSIFLRTRPTHYSFLEKSTTREGRGTTKDSYIDFGKSLWNGRQAERNSAENYHIIDTGTTN